MDAIEDAVVVEPVLAEVEPAHDIRDSHLLRTQIGDIVSACGRWPIGWSKQPCSGMCSVREMFRPLPPHGISRKRQEVAFCHSRHQPGHHLARTRAPAGTSRHQLTERWSVLRSGGAEPRSRDGTDLRGGEAREGGVHGGEVGEVGDAWARTREPSART